MWDIFTPFISHIKSNEKCISGLGLAGLRQAHMKKTFVDCAEQTLLLLQNNVFIPTEQRCFVTNDDEEIMCSTDEVRSGTEGRKTANLSVKETNKKGRLPDFKAITYMTPHSPNIYTKINMEEHLINFLSLFIFPFLLFLKKKINII